MGFGFHSHGRGFFLDTILPSKFSPQKTIQSNVLHSMMIPFNPMDRSPWSGGEGRTKGLGPVEYGAGSRLGLQLRSRRLELSPANTAITGFRRSHDNNLYNLEARFLGKVGWFFYIRFCVDGGYIIRFFSQWEADYWRDLKQIGYLQNLQIQRIISPFGLGHKCRHKM